MTKPAKPSAPVVYEKDGSVAIVCLNRPHVLNAYNVAMRDALFDALTAVRDDSDVRAMLLCGNGPAFCTGGDVREFGTAPSPTVARAVRFQRDVWGTLKTLRKVTIAAVHGYAVGGGFEMAMLCDLCLAADSARFALPETGLGMIPGVAGTQTATRLFGTGRTLDLLLTGREISAGEAFELGLVARVVPAGRLRWEALALAHRLARIDPELLQRVKCAINEGLDASLADGLALEARLTNSAARSRQPYEGSS
jgi:enoyl-CoA hydratase/carnithine racemase